VLAFSGLVSPLCLQGSPVVEVAPALLKKYATGKGNAGKDEVLAAAIRRYPMANITCNDIGDAVVLAAMGARHLGEPIESSLPQVNHTAMEKVAWPEVD
jgi:crossover junction endodeoxyribonuclease RuvC